jgi:hypothetical protein
MKSVILAALVAFVSWQALAATGSTCAQRAGKASGPTMHEKRTDWSGFIQQKTPAAPAQPRATDRVAKAQGTDNRG